MLFNSYIFIFVFLPLSLLIYHGLRHAGLERCSILSLTLLSLFFYGWWNPIYLLLLVPLTLAIFAIAKGIIFYKARRPHLARALLILGLAGSLGVLGYFKYANFFVDNVDRLFGLHHFVAHIVLPLGISFFTFQKIAFLVDAYRGKVDHLNLVDFSLFVSFFPQLIAGPIVHHSEVLPQFRQSGHIPGRYITMGITIFTIGLAKKVLLADTAALYATPQFTAVATGASLDFLAAWSGALAYSVQLYFDFSGYSDMAIGAALLFGIRLPVNFASPYKAASIIDFWRRWHITLSRFLRDYLYIPLGGNRHGKLRQYINLLLTMLLGGLWHGANWTLVLWGGLHGMYLVVNHAWHAIRKRISWLSEAAGPIEIILGRALTFIAVVVAWVFFRAADAHTALAMWKSMAGFNGLKAISDSGPGLAISGALLVLAWLGPNTQELTGYVGPAGAYGTPDSPVAAYPIRWQPTSKWAVLIGCLFAVAITSLSRISEFIYFQF
jgi:alginate O-acetyltransferase complex protein AlgI